ncbi:diphosphate--fructose-6-phosphate 1-phosphotransferase [Lancefieldella parvula]|uniref:diphosphate--fructose-6-phosphate 1-phosphotransferase n=1 Tax=Lancefieldella parvula TaxID=1382 RepID=UPI002880759B|nr:diphosphate--fructose-6-phosphate 1-phosphotransferase [Lancefieldella parvula]
MRKIRKILIGQSGGPTVAINSSLAGIIARAHEEGIEIYGMQNGIEGFLSGRYTNLTNLFFPQKNQQERSVDQQEHGVDQRGADQQKRTVELLAKTPSSFLGSCRYKLPEVSEKTSIYQDIECRLASLGIDGILYIDGNDSMDTVNKLATYFAQHNNEVSVIGIPKTIDNDLEGTDHSPGFGSSARYIATIVRELARDSEVYNKPNITIVETMGRDAGWLGAASALAREKNEEAPDFILLPEVAYDEERLLRKTAELFEHKNSVVIVISEGVRRPDGSTLLNKSHTKMDAFGHLADQSGNALYLADLFQKHFDAKIRGINLNSLQRCAMHSSSKTDLSEAFELGKAGVDALLAQKTGCMIGLQRLSDMPYQAEIRCIPISDIANRVKSVPAEMISDDGLWVTEKALAYLRPLVSNEELAFDADTRRFVSSNISTDDNGLPPFIPKLK